MKSLLISQINGSVSLEVEEDLNDEATERSVAPVPTPAAAPTGRRNPPGGKSSFTLG